ncbi:MAG: hypothetical protein ABFE07_29610 [Armatimonadia bacterium]
MTAPIIHVGAPAQRARTNLVDVPYKGYSVAGNPCNLVAVEYSLTGEFAGEQLPCTPKVADVLHDGTAQLAFVPGGADLNFVWDAGADLESGELSDVAQVRMRAAEGLDLSTYSTSSEFVLDTRSAAAADVVHYSRGQTATLKLLLIGRDGDPLDPADLELGSVVDPEGTEMLYAPVAATKVTDGLWSADYEVPIDAVLGSWTATWSYTLEDTATLHETDFVVDSGVEVADIVGDSTCAVRGQLFQSEGVPLVGANVYFIPYHLSDPELGNPTRISERLVTIVTDTLGRFAVELIRNLEGYIYIPALGFKQFVRVPDTAAAEFRTMIVELPTGTRDKFGNRVTEEGS